MYCNETNQDKRQHCYKGSKFIEVNLGLTAHTTLGEEVTILHWKTWNSSSTWNRALRGQYGVHSMASVTNL